MECESYVRACALLSNEIDSEEEQNKEMGFVCLCECICAYASICVCARVSVFVYLCMCGAESSVCITERGEEVYNWVDLPLTEIIPRGE